MSSQQNGFPATAEEAKHEITQQIEKIKTFLRSTGKWNEEWKEIMRKIVEESMVDDDSQRPSSSSIASGEDQTKAFFRTQKGKQLLRRLTKKIQDSSNIDIQVEDFEDLLDSPQPESTDGGLKAIAKQEEELQRRAMREKERDPGEVFLQASYDDLEHQLKQCLLCFSAFPANQVIKKRTVIYWWIGEGLVSAPGDGRTAEQMGEACFKKLITSGLIEPIYQKPSRSAKYCKIYPWVRKMLVSKAKEANFFVFDDQDRPALNHDQCKRACLAVGSEEKVWVAVSSQGRASGCLSLFNYNVQYLRCDQDKLEKFKEIATLQLGRWQKLPTDYHVEVANDSFLNGLKSLTKLKYLSLHGISRITKLPDSIESLANLLILDLRSCRNLRRLAPKVGLLTSLTHLDVAGCYLLDKMPKGIRSMSNLQVLKGFVVGDAQSDEDSCTLSELTGLQKLWKLSICIENNERFDLSELSKITSLRSLRITWSQVKAMIKTEYYHPSFPELEKLVLECVPNDESVSWLKPGGFGKLKRLYIEGGKLTKLSLAKENEKWNIEILRLKFLKELKLDWVDIGKQPSEQKLEWTDITMELPSLRGAQIIDCGIAFAGFDEKGIWERGRQAASSRSIARTGHASNRIEASSSPMVGASLVSEIEELSSSSMSGTS